MPYVLTDLVIDRVDLVDEGANSAAFIELFKRKEQDTQMDVPEIIGKLKPEHASVIQQELATLTKQRDDALADVDTLTKQRDEALADAETAKARCKKECDKAQCKKECDMPGCEDDDEMEDMEKGVGFDETEVLKAMPEQARAMFEKMREQKEAAEEQVRKNAEEKAEAAAIAKAATMKSLPIEQAKLVEILKSCGDEVTELLAAASAAIDNAVLNEVGKSKGNGASNVDGAGDAWSKIEAKAEEIAKRDSITKQKAVSVAIKENPALYKEYLDGGAN